MRANGVRIHAQLNLWQGEVDHGKAVALRGIRGKQDAASNISCE
jgi:hypothetical protein